MYRLIGKITAVAGQRDALALPAVKAAIAKGRPGLVSRSHCRCLPALLSLLLACSDTAGLAPPVEPPGPGSGMLTTDRTTYPAGADGTVTLTNDGPSVLGYNLCARYLDRLSEDRWRVVHQRPGKGEACTQELNGLEPGHTAIARFELLNRLGPGTYRWRFSGVGDPADAPEGLPHRVTNAFVVGS